MKTFGRGTLACLSLIVGCTSAKHSAYEKLASELNPILITLSAKVAAIVAMAPYEVSNREAMFQVCSGADAELTRLASVELDGALDIAIADTLVTFEAEKLASRRRSPCEPLATGGRDRRCAWFCLSAWQALTGGLRRIRTQAAAEGVAIYDIAQVPQHQ